MADGDRAADPFAASHAELPADMRRAAIEQRPAPPKLLLQRTDEPAVHVHAQPRLPRASTQTACRPATVLSGEMRKATLLVLVLTLTGCGGGKSGSPSPTSAPSAGAPSGMTITVTEKEFSIAPETISVPSPGMYVIKAVNKGQITHALEIEGKGVEAETHDISPGSSATLRVNLTSAGPYEVYCPIDGHEAKGMKARLVVGNVTGAPTATLTTTEETTTGRSGY
jgi:plastocyanin